MDIETSKHNIDLEEAKTDPSNLTKILLIQRKYRQHLEYLKVSALAKQIGHLRKNPVKPEDPTEEHLKQYSLKQGFNVLPSDALVNIFSFMATYEQLDSLSKTCKLWNQICRINALWLECLKTSYPQVYSEYDFATTNISEVSWKDIVKEKTLLIQAFRRIVSTLSEQKEIGNSLYNEQKIAEAAKCYKDAVNYAKKAKKDMDFASIVSKDLQVGFLRIMAILLANSSMAEIKLENWPKAFYDAVKARKKLKAIKELMDDNVEYRKQFGGLEEKVILRLRQAWQEFPAISFVRYSDQIVEGVGVGTVIEATDHIPGGIFGGAQLMMTEYDRTQSIKGVIINKMRWVEGRAIRIGGPCERSTVTVLHNIPDAEGAQRVIEGVWVGGNVEPFRGDARYKINEYYGYASWFDGQLDGELRNNDWNWHNNGTAEQVFRDY